MNRFSSIHALLLAEDESCLALDRKVLRRLGVTRTQFFASGRKALDYLLSLANVAALRSANGSVKGPAMVSDCVTMLICNERLADMTGMRFLSCIRSMPGMADIPVLLLVSNGESVVARAARATNSCAVLARPYTLAQAEAALALASQPEARHAPLVLPPSFIDRFGPRTEHRETTHENNTLSPRRAAPQPSAPKTAGPAPSGQRPVWQPPGAAARREGIAALRRGDMVAADSLLQGSYQTDPENSETCLALSKLAASRHQEKEELMWLCKAGVLCLKYGDKYHAGTIFSRLPRGKSGQDPLLAEAGLILQAGEVKAAALSFLEAHKLDPSKPLHALIGRTCMFTPAPEEHMRGLIEALSKAGHDATAGKLHQRLLLSPRADGEKQEGFLIKFPLLHDIVSVASYTFRTWRQAA